MRWIIDADQSLVPRIFLSGTITEQDDFAFVDSIPRASNLAIDLADIQQINSCGVREWIQFMRNLANRSVTFELLRCSPPVVRQLNMVANFLGDGRVRSFMAPYYCEQCGHDEFRLHEVVDDHEQPKVAESVVCGECGQDAEFDDLLPTYLGFLN